MSTISDDKELVAIGQIIAALESLEVEEKKRVLDYVFNRLGLKNFRVDSQNEPQLPKSNLTPVPTVEEDGIGSISQSVTDIRSLTDTKQPKSAIQMAVVVAYYLSEKAPPEERKMTINSSDLVKYFKQANVKLPNGEPVYTLRNAKNAGYLELTGETGEYKLNPVGYNLVAHRLPSSNTLTAERPRKKSTPKKAAAKKVASKKK